MSTSKQLEVHKEDQIPRKWSVPLGEEAFRRFFGCNPAEQKVFGEGSLFSPLLFGKFFDPADAFPLWDFESEVLLSGLRSSGKSSVDWFQTDHEYVLHADLPDAGKNTLKIFTERPKLLEISGRWAPPREAKAAEWRTGHWWEQGFVRRLELPDDADCRRMEASVKNETVLEIKIPKCETNQGAESKVRDAEDA